MLLQPEDEQNSICARLSAFVCDQLLNAWAVIYCLTAAGRASWELPLQLQHNLPGRSKNRDAAPVANKFGQIQPNVLRG